MRQPYQWTLTYWVGLTKKRELFVDKPQAEARLEELRECGHRTAGLYVYNARDDQPSPPAQTLREQVMELHGGIGAPVLATPQTPPPDRLRLRLDLITEEFFELLAAAGFALWAPLENEDEYGRTRVRVDKPELEPAWRTGTPAAFDLVAVADALGDLDYVVEGTRLECGIDGAPIAAEIHRTNMNKLSGETRADGKKLKPPGWLPPDIRGLLIAQGWTPP
jgi:predicted HAD superfamily Cof-like phosphohydrolase